VKNELERIWKEVVVVEITEKSLNQYTSADMRQEIRAEDVPDISLKH
jgi:hypothetical protein